jgi:YVTN family beta-propeller protein
MSAGRVVGAIVLLVLPWAGCAPQPIPYPPALAREGELHVYLQPIPQEAHRLEFSISEIAAVREDGLAIPLLPDFTELKCRDLLDVQKHLAWSTLPPGSYQGITLRIGRASLIGGLGSNDLLVPEEPLRIAQEFRIIRRASSTLFLSLAPARPDTGRYRFTPEFALAKPTRQLNSLLGFVTNSGSNLVTVFNKVTMQVVDTIATSSGPRGAAIDQRRGWVFVALAGDDAIEAVEVNTGEILRRLQLNFGDRPVEMQLSPDASTLVSVNAGSNSASIINAGVLIERGRVALPSEPASVVVGRSSQRAFVLQPMSNALTAIDLSRAAITATVTLDDPPLRGAVGREGNTLYVVTRYSSDLLAIDTNSLAVIDRIYVGSGAASVEVDHNTGLIYVGRTAGGIAVVDPSTAATIDRFRSRGNAAFLAIDEDQNSLFVVRPDNRTVEKLDIVSKRLKGAIEVGKEPYAVVLMGGR